jgi:branched-chain amino acid transport system substrate-binding protein
MRSPARSALLLLAGLSALLITGCGGGAAHRHSARRHQRAAGVQAVAIYSSLPLTGPAAGPGRSIAAGIRLAWRQAGQRAGSFLVRYRSLNDARPGHGGWEAGRTAADARRVATDAAAMAYIGDFDSGATQVSLPILNAAGIPQISPWSPYVGLTRSVFGVTAPGEPSRYYPSSMRTFLRLAPDDAVQTGAMLQAAHEAGCTRLAILRGGGVQGYGRELMVLLGVQAPGYGLRIVSRDTLDAASLSLRRYLISLRSAVTGCLAYVGSASRILASVLAAVRGELPRAVMIASAGPCGAAYDQPAIRAPLVAASGGRLQCMLPAVAPSVPGQARFLSSWRAAHGKAARPGPWAAYGYATMQILMQTIAELGPKGDQRTALLHALLASQRRNTALGAISFDRAGDVSLRAYGLYRVEASAPPPLVRVLEPPLSTPNLS